jgi:hypothetical protein
MEHIETVMAPEWGTWKKHLDTLGITLTPAQMLWMDRSIEEGVAPPVLCFAKSTQPHRPGYLEIVIANAPHGTSWTEISSNEGHSREAYEDSFKDVLPCEYCNGTGEEERPCVDCGGDGDVVIRAVGGGCFSVDCKTCIGTGQFYYACWACGGSGEHVDLDMEIYS